MSEEFDETTSEHIVTYGDGYEFAIDGDGIMWIKLGEDAEWERPCLKDCYTQLKLKDKEMAVDFLSLVCLLQDDVATYRKAMGYLKYYSGFYSGL